MARSLMSPLIVIGVMAFTAVLSMDRFCHLYVSHPLQHAPFSV